MLGPEKFYNETAERTELPGVATGLAWTAGGGDILFIEATRMQGKGTLTLTIRTPGAGLFKAKAKTKFGGKKVTYGKGSRSAAGPGTVTLKIHPRKDVKADLIGGASLKVSVAVTFRPDGDTPRTKTKTLTVG